MKAIIESSNIGQNSTDPLKTPIMEFEDRLLQKAYENLLPREVNVINEKAYLAMCAFLFVIVLVLLSLVIAVGQDRAQSEPMDPKLVKTQLVPNKTEVITPSAENQAYLKEDEDNTSQFYLSSAPKQ